jgi:hypothetical protein
MQRISNKKTLLPILIDIAIIVLLAFYYGYHHKLTQRPQSIHAWRQADCASIALNYYQHGMHFFRPEVHNLNSDKGTTGYCATSEVPVLYYIAAILYSVFGYHEGILRLINTLLYLLGLFYLFRLLYYLYKDLFWSVSLSILFFTSAVLIYYGNNFLSNVPAFSMALVGWYYFFRYAQEKTRMLLSLSLVFFLLAGFLKVSALMSLFALCGYFIFEQIAYKREHRIFKQHFWYFVAGSGIIILATGAWIFYAWNYNRCHDCSYFSTTIFPIWDMSMEDIISFTSHIYHTWLRDYFHPVAHIFFVLLALICIVNIKSIPRYQGIILILLVIQSIIYILTQFWTFYDHDYYTIDLNIVPVFLVITGFAVLFKKYPVLLRSMFLKMLFAIFLIFNIYYAEKQVAARYSGWKMQYYNERPDIYSISDYLNELGIATADKVIFIPDGSNVSLYLMNRPGWTQYTDARFNRKAPILYNNDSSAVAWSIKKGAKYLIVNSFGDLYKYPYLQSFAHNLAGQYESVLVFDLKDTITNFNCNERQVKTLISCNAELVDKNKFLTSVDSLFLGNASTQSDETSYTGAKCAKVTMENPYGMTFITDSSNYGESFLIEVWKKGNAEAGIIASAPEFFLNQNSIEEVDSVSGWQRLKMEFFISKNIEDKELKIYLYNPTDKPAYFDDLKITWYHSPLTAPEKTLSD